MTSVTRAATSPPAKRSPSRSATAVVQVFRDPMRTFVAVALVVGGYFVFTVPYFGGIDEPAHFYRSYQISTGRFVPQKIAGSEFSGACVPRGLVRDVERYQRAYFQHLVSLAPDALAHLPSLPARQHPHCASASDASVTFSTFGSPIPYVPQVAALLVARGAGFGAGGILVLGRIVLLLACLAVAAFAIRRSPRARWALGATALIPVAVFQAAPSLSHDAMTTAVAILVVSSALRATDPPEGVRPKALIIEAALL